MISRGKMTMKKQLLIKLLAVSVAALLLAGCGGGLGNSIWAPDEVEAPEFEEVEGSLGLTPGVHAGVGTGGFGGDIYLEVTVGEDGGIEYIEVTSHSETASFLNMALPHVTMNVIGTQSTDIDTFTGATETFNALIDGIEDALVSGAGADLAALRAGPG